MLPDGRQINHLYYGSGHLHGILFDGDTVTDIERDKLHREIQRTQGKLTSRYELDPLGRLKKQIAQLEALTETGKGKNKVSAGQTAVKRSYGYDKTGNLTHSTDQRTGTIHYEYDPIGQIKKAGDSLFAFDPAHNIIDSHERKVPNNRISEYGGVKFFYDEFGNTIHKEHPDGTTQNLYYDVFHQLVKTETFKPNQQTGIWDKETWVFDYDALGRRIRKGRLKESGGVSDGLEEITEFIWSGSRLLQEVYAGGRYTYIYAGPNSYEPLAQIHNHTNAEGETKQEINYFHCDQIGIPREMTDKDGNLLWFGEYDAWGKLTGETNVTGTAHQPFRLQNQYCDTEIGLHYNFFRYYDPDTGRFVNQDPIGLWGGDNFYRFASNTTMQIDPLGLSAVGVAKGVLSFIAVDTMTPKPTDAAWPKWAVYAVAGAAATGVIALSESDTCVGRCAEEKKRKKRCKKWGQGNERQAQMKVMKNQAPRGIKRIDEPHGGAPNAQWHAHDLKDAALNIDGTIHDKHRGVPNFGKDERDFLFCHGWNI